MNKDLETNRSASERPRVLQVITRLGLGGAEQVSLSIVRGLRSEVHSAVFTVHGHGNDDVGREMERSLRELGVPWFQGTRCPMKAGGPLPAAWALARAVREFAPDVVHCHAEPAEATVATWRALFARRAKHIKVLRTVHNSVFWRFWPRVGRWVDRQLAEADVVAVSEAARTEFLRYRAESRGLPTPQVKVIYNGVSLAPQPARPLSDSTSRRVLFAGRFEDQKGVDVLARALSRVELPQGVRGEMTFIGHGLHEPLLRELATHPPTGWRVEIRPPVGRLPSVFSSQDLLVMPSRFEGLGLVAIEATLCGMPVVATDAPGLREALPADHPWWVRPEDEADLAKVLTAALGAPTHWSGTVASAQSFATQRFAPRVMVDGYNHIFLTARESAKAC